MYGKTIVRLNSSRPNRSNDNTVEARDLMVFSTRCWERGPILRF